MFSSIFISIVSVYSTTAFWCIALNSLVIQECLEAGQDMVNHHLCSRLNTLGATRLKVNGANLIIQNNTLCLGA